MQLVLSAPTSVTGGGSTTLNITTTATTATGTYPLTITATSGALSHTAGTSLTITSGTTSPTVNFAGGFSTTGMQFNGHTKLNGTRLQLTDTSTTFQVASAYWGTKVNVSNFSNTFNFQLTNPGADGITFVIQNVSPTAIGPWGSGLGYGAPLPGGTGGIANSVAVKFDIHNNNGEGTNSTGLYVNGASPTTPATTFGGGVNLLSGDTFQVQMTYDGTTLTMVVTDLTTPANTSTTSWAVNIPTTVGAQHRLCRLHRRDRRGGGYSGNLELDLTGPKP